MEREGNNTESTASTGSMAPTEQPQAPDSNVVPNNTQAEASPVFQPVGQMSTTDVPTPTADAPAPTPAVPTPDTSAPVANNQSPATNIPAPSTNTPTSRTPNKKPFIIAGIAVAGVLLVVGIIALVINLVNSNNANNRETSIVISENGYTEEDDNAQNTEVEERVAQFVDNSDIDGMIGYIDSVVNEYNNGTGYQELTPRNIGNLYTTGLENINDYITANMDQFYTYGDTLLRYSQNAESLLQTASSAVDVFFAEMFYGSREKAEQYKQIAIERDPNIWSDSNGEGE